MLFGRRGAEYVVMSEMNGPCIVCGSNVSVYSYTSRVEEGRGSCAEKKGLVVLCYTAGGTKVWECKLMLQCGQSNHNPCDTTI